MKFKDFIIDVEKILLMSGEDRVGAIDDLKLKTANKLINVDGFVEDINNMLGLQEDAEQIRDSWDDYGASPGCECGCGGDTFDWDGQSIAFDEAREYEKEAASIYKRLKRDWEAR